ncbi:hypothetical protein ACPPVO_14320 [Dactylosporangium sp. McL0621]|uniref:hypothetical protein n=1 Tax=Dactylosporangium sp. McL0621 TaxID=3415678 RepID=UPI003CEB6BDA
MSTTLWEFRQLYFTVRDDAPIEWGGEVLRPWLEARPHVLAELRELGRPDSRRARFTSGGREYTPLEGLYPLGRVVDLLIAPHQPVDFAAGAPRWVDPLPSAAAWAEFRAAIGAVTVDERAFHPFFHEIVEVVPAEDPAEPPSLVREFWPGALVGGMLLARAGVAVRAGARHLDPEVAARSCLYWAWWRRNRPSADLSHGWGHNSQWGTDFRRDYVADGALHYNVDVVKPYRPVGADLVRYRCSTLTDLGDQEWPYHTGLTEPAP